MSVRLRNPQGGTVYVPDDQATQAIAQGFTRETDDQATADLTEREKAGGGVGGAIAAGASSIASGATLGLSDVALSSVLSKGDTRDLAESREAHPFISGAGQVAGMLATAGAGEASFLGKMPGGYLARAANEGVEASRAVGGIQGALGVAGVSGLEGAAQSGGMYLADSALGDRDLTAEGMAGALGSGFAFGSVAGGATYGLEKGTIAARRMFARTAEGGELAAKDAASAFNRQSDTVLQAHEDAATIARKRLDEIQSMKAEAQAQKQYATTEIADARLARFDEQAMPKSAPEAPPTAPELGQPAVPPAAPSADAPPEAPSPAQSPVAAKPKSTRLEDQLAEMKSKIDGGATIQDLNAARSPVINTEALLGPQVAAEEQKLTTALSDYEARRAKVNEWIAKAKNPRTSYESNADEFGAGQSNLVRARRSEALPEDVFVEQSTGQLRTIGKGEHTLADITPNSRILAASNGKSFAKGQILDDAYNDAIERAKLAETPAMQDAALHEAADIEQRIHSAVRDAKPENAAVIDHIEKVREANGRTGFHAAFARAERQAMDEAEATTGARFTGQDRGRPSLKVTPDSVALDAHDAATIVSPYEKAAADLTEAVGDAAPQAAKDAADGYRAAEAAADAKQMDRTARAVDDHVQYGPAEEYGPQYRSPKDRIKDAQRLKLDADAKLSRLGKQETEVRATIPEAPPKLKQEVEAGAAAEKPRSKFQRAKDVAEKVGGALEIASMAGIPGIPSPHDIPVVGPLLGAYLKFRALTGKLTGRIPATGEARAAALAAKTRDKLAHSVDRMLGLAEKAAPAARTVAVASSSRAGEILAKRLFDDGQPDAPKEASIREVAAVRMREVTHAAMNPQMIIAEVRKHMADVTDPTLIAAAEQHQVAKFQYLASKAPAQPTPGILAEKPPLPSPAAVNSWACRVEAANDPEVVFKQLEAGRVTIEGAETLQSVFSKLFAEAQQRLMERAPEAKTTIPYQQKLRMGLLYNVPLDRLSDPETIASLQSNFSKAAPSTNGPASPTPNAPPTPSVAGPVNLASLYTTDADRRASRR